MKLNILVTRINTNSWKSLQVQFHQRLCISREKANDVFDAAKKQAIFLSVVGDKTYKLISDLATPKKPTEKSFKELVELLTTHL